MTFYHGLGMFILGMAALFIAAIVAYIIINKFVNYKNSDD
jgi:hypothetical protein